jgi:chromosome segregation ATPase
MSDTDIDPSDTIRQLNDDSIRQLNDAINTTTEENKKIDKEIEKIKQKIEQAKAKAEGIPKVTQRYYEELITNKQEYIKRLRLMKGMVKQLQSGQDAEIQSALQEKADDDDDDVDDDDDDDDDDDVEIATLIPRWLS